MRLEPMIMFFTSQAPPPRVGGAWDEARTRDHVLHIPGPSTSGGRGLGMRLEPMIMSFMVSCFRHATYSLAHRAPLATNGLVNHVGFLGPTL